MSKAGSDQRLVISDPYMTHISEHNALHLPPDVLAGWPRRPTRKSEHVECFSANFQTIQDDDGREG